jgi:hypothetical protein
MTIITDLRQNSRIGNTVPYVEEGCGRKKDWFKENHRFPSACDVNVNVGDP